jgi:hypothetical protein
LNFSCITKTYKLIQQPPTGPTDQEAYMDSKEKGFSTIEFNTPKIGAFLASIKGIMHMKLNSTEMNPILLLHILWSKTSLKN